LPLIKKYKTGIVALTMDDKEMPEDYEGRMRITRDLVKITQEEGISLNRVYFDHLVRPSSTNAGQARFILDAIRATRKEFPEAHIVFWDYPIFLLEFPSAIT